MEVLLYWITRLDAIHIMIIAGIIITAAIGIASGLISLCDGCEKGEVCRKKALLVFKRTLPFFLLFIMMRTFIPTAQEALVIIGVGTTIEYLQSNETAKQIPDKTIRALDKLINDYLGDDYKK